MNKDQTAPHSPIPPFPRFPIFPLPLFAFLSVVLLALCSASRQAGTLPNYPAPMVWAVDAMTKVRPGIARPEQPAKTITLYGARNEYEPFQIVVAAGDRPLKQIDVEATPLKSGGGQTIDAQKITIYREGFINVKTPSDIEGRTGLWPDALIPKIDAYVGERRNAFPFDLAPQALQPIWLDLFVPANASPGEYAGRVRVLEAGQELGAVDLKLVVWNFELPATSSFPNTFGFSGLSAVKGHYGHYTSDEDMVRFAEIYGKAALLHRLSLHGGSFIPPACKIDADGHVKIDWTNYDREVAPFLDGTALPSGARFTTIDLRTPQNLTDEQKIDYWRQWCAHFRQRGWFERLFDYTWDEPNEADFDKIRAKAALLQRADPQIPALVTKELHPKLQSAVSIWTVVINYIDDKPGNSNSPTRSAYERELAAGHKLWWYQACMSHGCNIVGGEYFTGWPAYIIDLPAIYSRIMPWAAWKYRISGELYYNTVEAYGRQDLPNWNPWENLYYFGGNGDGTLFYPGTPEKIGGHTHIPIESIRLKMIREGLEDYEYLRLAALGDRSAADRAVERLITRTYIWDHNGADLMEARAQLAASITGVRDQGSGIRKTGP